MWHTAPTHIDLVINRLMHKSSTNAVLAPGNPVERSAALGMAESFASITCGPANVSGRPVGQLEGPDGDFPWPP